MTWFVMRPCGRFRGCVGCKGVELIGYRYSVYTWIARLALRMVDQPFEVTEVDPFEPDAGERLPFGRVPVLYHEGETIYETAAITRYLARLCDREELLGTTPLQMAQVDQVIAIVDAYGYQPMVRKVFAHGVFRPLFGEMPDAQVIADGLRDAETVLRELETIAAQKRVLSGSLWTLADVHLAPMMDYFVRVPEAADMLAEHTALCDWWDTVRCAPRLRETAPDFGDIQVG